MQYTMKYGQLLQATGSLLLYIALLYVSTTCKAMVAVKQWLENL